MNIYEHKIYHIRYIKTLSSTKEAITTHHNSNGYVFSNYITHKQE